MPWFSSSCGRIEIHLTLQQARSASHPGPCDADVLALSREPRVAEQLARIVPAILRDELLGYGWDAAECQDHDQNLQRVLWLAAGDILDNEVVD